ncbi:hypothetical protein UNDKW_4234 [Undibacterium sp. KW1]|nr:hypothetical protein UNDKW_4234 [Undibacterium sp. KW1]
MSLGLASVGHSMIIRIVGIAQGVFSASKVNAKGHCSPQSPMQKKVESNMSVLVTMPAIDIIIVIVCVDTVRGVIACVVRLHPIRADQKVLLR